MNLHALILVSQDAVSLTSRMYSIGLLLHRRQEQVRSLYRLADLGVGLAIRAMAHCAIRFVRGHNTLISG
jgi:hypothetical protein